VFWGGGDEATKSSVAGCSLVLRLSLLIAKARREARLRQGGGQVCLNIDDLDIGATTPKDNILPLNEALECLAEEDPERGRICGVEILRRRHQRGASGHCRRP
jgi:hypothetical protein